MCACVRAPARDKGGVKFHELHIFTKNVFEEYGEHFWKICVLNWRSFLRNMYVYLENAFEKCVIKRAIQMIN